MCEKVNKDIRYNFYPIFPLHWTIQNILHAANPTTVFLQKASWPGKNNNLFIFDCFGIGNIPNKLYKIYKNYNIITNIYRIIVIYASRCLISVSFFEGLTD